jgi:hypothetical protein
VRIAGHDYSVNYAPHSFGMTHPAVIGECNLTAQEITINEHLHPDMQMEVFFHEVIHAIVKQYNVPMPEDDEICENIVVQLGIGIFQVMKDNNLINPNIFKLEKSKTKKG